jgi:hypothetical protein
MKTNSVDFKRKIYFIKSLNTSETSDCGILAVKTTTNWSSIRF